MSEQKHKYYFVRESFLQSVLSDSATFGFLLGSIWFNQVFIGGSYFLNGIILVMFIIFLFAKSKKRTEKEGIFYSVDALIKHLENTKKVSL